MEYVLKSLSSELNIDKIANVHFFEFPKDFYTETDAHPFYELVFTASGKLDIKSENFSGTLKKDEIIIHTPNENHSLTCDSESTPTVIIIGFSSSCKHLNLIAGKPITLENEEIKKLAEIIKEARNVFLPPYDTPVLDMKKRKDNLFGSEQMLKNLLEYFFISLLRRFIVLNKVSDNKELSLPTTDRIIDYLTSNYKEKITIDELAFIFSTNRSSLCKDFKNATGKTVIQFLTEKKIEKAKELILSTKKTFTEIAEELNFESIHYFTRLFKKNLGISPKEYRLKNTTNYKIK